MRKNFSKFTAAFLAFMMFVSMLPAISLPASAAVVNGTYENAQLDIVSDHKSALAPGVTMNEMVVYDKNGSRVEMYVVTADSNVGTVQFYANYKDNQNQTWGMQTLSGQVAAIEANYDKPFKVVAGVNAAYYDTNNGKPLGAFVMEGVAASTDAAGNSYPFFAVLKDGTVMIGAKGEYTTYKDQIKEAVQGHIHLVKDGAICNGLDAKTKYPRQTVGITADGKVIFMTADGNQSPVTAGLTVQEQAQVMLDLGCVEALHLDGGNSTTLGTVPEGTDKFVLTNTPESGVEREVSNTLLIVSTAVADGTFDHALIESDYDYYAPNSAFTFTASGVDATGGPAEIPANITWALSDASFGSIENGAFVSNGKLGSVDVQVLLDGNVVGKRTISIVNPESITFGAAEKTVPYGKSASMEITAIYNNNEMYCTADAYDFVVGVGSMNGFNYTATSDESVTSTTLTATYKYDSALSAISVTLKFGKGSEVIFDFEDGDISNWMGSDVIVDWIDKENAKYTDAVHAIQKPNSYSNSVNGGTSTHTFLATENKGEVKYGDYSLGLTFNRTYSQEMASWQYSYMYYTGDPITMRDTANGMNATKIGMWVYFPEEAADMAFRLAFTYKQSDGTLATIYKYMNADSGTQVGYNFSEIPEGGGWVYIYYDLTAETYASSTQYDPYVKYKKEDNTDFYPAFLQFFGNTMQTGADSFTVYIDDITIEYSDVVEDRDAPTITGAGVSVGADNFVALSGQTVNVNELSFQATIAENTKKTNYTGLDYTTAKIYIDGVEMSGVKAAGNTMALSGVKLANGTHEIVFEIADKQGNYVRNTKTITVDGTDGNAVVTLEGHNDSGTTPLAGSVYYLDIKASDAAAVQSATVALKLNTANSFIADQIIAPYGVSVSYEFDALTNTLTLSVTNDSKLAGEQILATVPVRVWAWDSVATGITNVSEVRSPEVNIVCEAVGTAVTYADGTSGSFYDAVNVDTEVVYKDSTYVSSCHTHTAAAIDDKAPTCTENGYTGRTYCEGCASVIDWGTTVPATGHSYERVDNQFVCNCGDVMKLTTGLFEVNGKNYYAVNGILEKGWVSIDDDWYFFDEGTFVGLNGEQYANNGIKFNFENGRVTNGVWVRTAGGLRYWYGPNYYRDLSSDVKAARPYVIDGNTYLFNRNGYMQTGICYHYTEPISTYYDCGEDGVATLYSGPIGNYFYLDGLRQNAYQLIQLNGDYYFIGDGHQYAKNCKVYLSGSFIEGTDFTAGYYEFGADGKLIIKNGAWSDGYFYLNGVRQEAYQLIKFEGDYYFINDGHKYAKNCKVYLSGSFIEGTDFTAGYYEFGADGKLIIKNGAWSDGYFYLNGVRQEAYQLIKFEGDYYFISDGHKYAKNTTLFLNNKFVDGSGLGEGYYSFDANGRMILN